MTNLQIESLTSEDLREIIKTEVKKALESMNHQKESEDKYLTLEEAAEFIKYSTNGVYGLVSKRSIPFYKKGKRLVFKRSELKKWMEEGRVSTIDELKNA